MKKIHRQKIKWRSRFLLGTDAIQTIQDRTPLRMSTKYRLSAVAVFCVICLFITVILGQSIEPFHTFYGKIAYPFQKMYLSVENFVSDTVTTLKRIRSLEKENQRLTEELEYYVYENTTLKTEVIQSEEILALYELDHYYEAYPKTGAQIVGLSNNNWYDSLIIDKGIADGIAKDMPVLASGGLLGRVTKVYEHYSVVTTLINSESRIFGEVNRLNRSVVNVSGSAELEGAGLCMIEFDPNETDLVAGDEIVTSALGEIYPPGLLIGTVTEIQPSENGLTNTALLKPASDTTGLSYVLIITELWKEDMKAEMGGAQP